MSVKDRWRAHRNAYRKHPNWPIARAIRKYGPSNFTLKVVASIHSSEPLLWSNPLEADFIAVYNSCVPHGYNLNAGGNNRNHHPDTKAKMSASRRCSHCKRGHLLPPKTNSKYGRRCAVCHSLRRKAKYRALDPIAKQELIAKQQRIKKRNWNAEKAAANRRYQHAYYLQKQALHPREIKPRKPMSAETKAKIGAAQKGNKNRVGRRHSLTTRRKLSQVAKRRPVRIGIRPNDETRAKMSIAQTRRWARG